MCIGIRRVRTDLGKYWGTRSLHWGKGWSFACTRVSPIHMRPPWKSDSVTARKLKKFYMQNLIWGGVWVGAKSWHRNFLKISFCLEITNSFKVFHTCLAECSHQSANYWGQTLSIEIIRCTYTCCCRAFIVYAYGMLCVFAWTDGEGGV